MISENATSGDRSDGLKDECVYLPAAKRESNRQRYRHHHGKCSPGRARRERDRGGQQKCDDYQ